jgi:serine/threonine-protein kinase RsbW
MFTDGIYQLYSDNVQIARKMFEKHALDELNNGTHKKLLDSLRDMYSKFTVEESARDDVTAVAIEILTQSRKNQIKERLGFDTGDPVYLQFISYFEEMDSAISVILSTLDVYGYPDEAIRKMKITLTELLVNAILHGHKRDYTKKVTIGHVISRVKAEIAIMDEGPGYNPQALPDPTLPENLERDCGRGLFIVRHYVDEIDFNKSGNRIKIVKKFSLSET